MPIYDDPYYRQFRQLQMTTPTTGGTNTAGTQPTTTMQPTSIWDTQPKPASTTNRLATYQSITGQQPMVPPLPGDSTMGNPVEMPAFGTTDRSLRPPLTASGDTAYRGTQFNALQNFVPAVPATPGVNPATPAAPGGVPIPGQYQFPGNFSYPAFSYNQVEDYRQNPAYQNQLRESERALNRQLLARGRSDSTGGINALATNQRRLGAEFEQQAYARAVAEDNNNYARLREQNTTEYDRALMMNKLMYDRGYQERITDYEQKFRENERQYGRAKAEEQLAYDRQWNEAARDYAYWKYLVEVGLRASGVPAA